LRTEHTQQGLGNAAQIFPNIQADESISMTRVKLVVKGQLCVGACEPGGVSIGLPCPTANPLLPRSGFIPSVEDSAPATPRHPSV